MLFTLVGPAGAGKNTVMQRVIQLLPGLRQLPTATTRAMRVTEAEGREHYFVNDDEFLRMREAGELVESQIVHGNWYGIAREPLENALRNGEVLVADIDMFGARAARGVFPNDTVLIFVAPPTLSSLVTRMRERGEPEAQIARRLLRAPDEMAFAPECDYVVVNDTLDQAAQAVLEIMTWEKRRHEKRYAASFAPPVEYIVRVVTLHGGDVALSDSEALPECRFERGRAPLDAALDALRPLGIMPPLTAFTTFEEGAAFVPPAVIDVGEDGGLSQCLYTYIVQLATRAPLAPGWRWRSVNDVLLGDSPRSMLNPVLNS
jgi:guanylate kinase